MPEPGGALPWRTAVLAATSPDIAVKVGTLARERIGGLQGIAADPQLARKRWINAMKPRGELRLDAGAVTALRAGKSLLPAGVTAVSGNFARGDVVDIIGPLGITIARGLSEYDSNEAIKIAGLKSAEIEAALGHTPRAAMVHRDHMVLL